MIESHPWLEVFIDVVKLNLQGGRSKIDFDGQQWTWKISAEKRYVFPSFT